MDMRVTMLLLGFRVQFVAVLRSVWGFWQICGAPIVLGVVDSDVLERFGVWVRFLSLRVSRFCLVFEFECCWNWEGASCWKPFASYSRNIDDDDDDDDDVRGQAGRGAER
jgi:hypothetical protein